MSEEDAPNSSGPALDSSRFALSASTDAFDDAGEDSGDQSKVHVRVQQVSVFQWPTSRWRADTNSGLTTHLS